MDTTYFNKFTHEIKNPLTICNGYLDILLKCNEKDKDTYIQIVRDEIKRSLGIINEYSNNRFLDIKKDNFNLYDLLIDLKKLYNIKIIILSNNNLNYYGDYSKLKQALINIIKNSYESNSSIIVIKVEDYKNSYKINIIDNGLGMNELTLDNIYKEYFTTKQEGTGLGVPLIKEIIELHNGSINYYSKENIGTKVEISLPK